MQPYPTVLRLGLIATSFFLACAVFSQAERPLPEESFFLKKTDTPNVAFQELESKSFSLKYPESWSIDKQQASYNPQHNITFTCPQNSYLRLYVFDKPQKDPKEELQDILRTVATAVVVYSKQNSNRWGSFPGIGMRLEGKMGGEYPGGIHIFVSDEVKGRSFVVTEFYYSEDLQFYQPGVDIIKRSLKLKPLRNAEKTALNQDITNDTESTNVDSARAQHPGALPEPASDQD